VGDDVVLGHLADDVAAGERVTNLDVLGRELPVDCTGWKRSYDLALHDIVMTNLVYGVWHTNGMSVGAVYCPYLKYYCTRVGDAGGRVE